MIEFFYPINTIYYTTELSHGFLLFKQYYIIVVVSNFLKHIFHLVKYCTEKVNI